MNTDDTVEQPGGQPEPVERHRAERGHAFYPSPNELARIPRLYATDATAADDKVVHLHYFVGGCDWWLVEYDPAEQLAFGYVRLHGDDAMAEWGYVSLPELEALYIEGSQRHRHDAVAGVFGPDAAERWQCLSLARRRAVITTLLERIAILPASRGRGFDPASVQLVWRNS